MDVLMEMARKQLNFKDLVKKGLTKTEQKNLKTAFDMVGDIAIIEVDEPLRKKERFIAETLLKCQKNINTVLRKDSAHSGKFRTQKLKYLAGEKKKETIHIESRARLRLDVERVYFSQRMSHERLRIAAQVKDGERILVMFSGCGVYPAVIAKNSRPGQIIGIELNPAAHEYALENARLNKLDNVELFQGDVKEIIPWLINKKIGLKSHWKERQLHKKLKYNPSLIELHLNPEDLDEHMEEIHYALSMLRGLKIEVVLHAPMRYKGMELNISADDKKVVDNSLLICKILTGLCKKYKLSGFVMHPYTWPLEKRMKNNIGYTNKKKVLEKVLKNNYPMLLENVPQEFFSETAVIKEIIVKHKLRLCLDLVHLYLASGSDRNFYESIRQLAPLKPYFHIADTTHEYSNRLPHARRLGTGSIDLEKIMPYINHGVIEVSSRNEDYGKEMLDSYKIFKRMETKLATFDRIIMPLPRGGENFLVDALSVAKKGTILHFYDFLHETEFDKAKDKVADACKKAGKKFKILDMVKCGQYSPRTYRICVDFRIMHLKKDTSFNNFRG